MKSYQQLKDPNREKRIYTARSVIAVLFVMLLVCVLVARMYYLQVLNHEHFQTLSDKNRMQLQSIGPTRGLIYDRNGVLLADNQPIFSVAVIPETVGNMDAAIAHVRNIIELNDEQIERFRQRLNRPRRPHQSVILKSNLSEEEIARLEARRHEITGVEVEAELARFYPFGELTAHAIGYVGRINEKELESVDASNYSATNYIGKQGVEYFYETPLHGKAGYRTVETNARNRILRVLSQVDPEPGVDLTLHLDIELQRSIKEILGERRGAVVAIEPETGGVLALVSTPGFDPNPFVTGIDLATYSALRDSPDLPLFNRALHGRYPPGSTIKPMVALAGLDTGTTTPEYAIYDPGFYQLKQGDRFFRDWKRGGHGRVDMLTAISQSCDTYFYELAYKMGVDDTSRYLGYFGFGLNTSVDIEEAREGILPSREWKRAVKKQSWYPGDSLNFGIGQGYMLTTPLQLATATALIATRGKWHAPAMLMKTSNEIMLPRLPDSDLGDVPLKNPRYWNLIIEAMAEVMHGPRGTARTSGAKASYRMAGKTGTAQVVAIKQGEKYDASKLDERHRDHALFVGFAPVEAPKIAVAVIVENGGGGSSTAAPVARQVFDMWLSRTQPDTPESPKSQEAQP